MEGILAMRQPFKPRIALTRVHNLFQVDLATGTQSSRTEHCLLCDKSIHEQGFVVIIDNGYRDNIEVGYCCLGHNCTEVRKKAISQAQVLLQARAEAIASLESSDVEIVIDPP